MSNKQQWQGKNETVELRKQFGDKFIDEMASPWVGNVDGDKLGLSFSPVKMKDIERFDEDLASCKTLCGIQDTDTMSDLRNKINTLENKIKELQNKISIYENMKYMEEITKLLGKCDEKEADLMESYTL